MRPPPRVLPRDLAQLLIDVNRLRAKGRAESSRRLADLEREADRRYRAGSRLIAYGTLAPGAPNHHIIAGLVGTWENGCVEGDFFPTGWGAVQGYPAMRWRPGAPCHPVHVLHAAPLTAAWDRLDRFEGDGYRRVLAPVWRKGRLLCVGNLYAIRDHPGNGDA